MSPGLVQGRGISSLSFGRAAIFQTEAVISRWEVLLLHQQHCLVPLCWDVMAVMSVVILVQEGGSELLWE